MGLHIAILAAGQGTRMCSEKPKVLQDLAGRALMDHVMDTAKTLSPEAIWGVKGVGSEQLESHCTDSKIAWVHQAEQKGTGHAVLQVLPQVSDADRLLVLCGDVPLIQAKTLKSFLKAIPEDSIGFISTTMDNPTGLGRVVRGADDMVTGVIEEKDASERERKIQEINTGIVLAPVSVLQKALPTFQANNAQGEVYLTDLFAWGKENGVPVNAYQAADASEFLGVNTRAQLAKAERVFQQRAISHLMAQGVTVRDPARCDIRGEVTAGQDTVIDINVLLEGQVQLGARCQIGPNVCLKNVVLGDDVTVLAGSVVDGATIESGVRIGPFARIRPGTVLKEKAQIGNFVEVKKSTIGEGTKVNHLSYIGDAALGADTNIGAGVITCNYDGVNKHTTVIEDGVFVGSGVQLVAPIHLETGAHIGAGSTLTKTAPARKLTLSRAKQVTIKHWTPASKNKD